MISRISIVAALLLLLAAWNANTQEPPCRPTDPGTFDLCVVNWSPAIDTDADRYLACFRARWADYGMLEVWDHRKYEWVIPRRDMLNAAHSADTPATDAGGGCFIKTIREASQ